MHLNVGDALHCCRAQRNKNEDKAEGIDPDIMYYGKNRRQYASVYDEGWHEVDAEEINEGVKDSRFFLEHCVAPILMIEAPEGIRPICRQADRPEGYGDYQHNTKPSKFPADCKRNEDNGGLNAPIGIVDRGVGEYQAEGEGHNGGHNVGDEQRKPPGEIQGIIGYDANYRRYNVYESYGYKAGQSVLL